MDINERKKELENRKEYIGNNILTGKYLLIGTWLWQNKNWHYQHLIQNTWTEKKNWKKENWIKMEDVNFYFMSKILINSLIVIIIIKFSFYYYYF